MMSTKQPFALQMSSSRRSGKIIQQRSTVTVTEQSIIRKQSSSIDSSLLIRSFMNTLTKHDKRTQITSTATPTKQHVLNEHLTQTIVGRMALTTSLMIEHKPQTGGRKTYMNTKPSSTSEIYSKHYDRFIESIRDLTLIEKLKFSRDSTVSVKKSIKMTQQAVGGKNTNSSIYHDRDTNTMFVLEPSSVVLKQSRQTQVVGSNNRLSNSTMISTPIIRLFQNVSKSSITDPVVELFHDAAATPMVRGGRGGSRGGVYETDCLRFEGRLSLKMDDGNATEGSKVLFYGDISVSLFVYLFGFF